MEFGRGYTQNDGLSDISGSAMSSLLNADEMHADGCSHVRPTHSLRLSPRRPAVLCSLTDGLDAKPHSVDRTSAPLYRDPDSPSATAI